MEVKITAFPAENGESILIECFGVKKTNILVDLGYSQTYKKFIEKKLRSLANLDEKIDLLVLTHYDADHIEGAIAFFEELLVDTFIDIEEIWVNEFLSLSSQQLDKNELNKEQESIYNFSKFMANIYRQGSSTITNKEISTGHSVTITKLIKQLGYDKKINESFVDKLVCVHAEDTDNLIKINNEVEITILAPQKSKLQEQLIDFLKWFEKNKNIHSYIAKEELYELFVASSDANKVNDTNNIIIKKEISSDINYQEKIESILRSKDTLGTNSLANKTSIAFSLKFKNLNLMFTGDIDAETLISELESTKNRYDLLKISHHGSKNNTNRLLLNSINCNNYLICTEGKGRSKHPNLETLVYIANSGNVRKCASNIYLNYPLNEINISKECMATLISTLGANIYQTDTKKESAIELIFAKGELIWKEAN